MSNRVWKVVSPPRGVPSMNDLTFTEEPIPRPEKSGDFVVRNLEMSLDPYIRGTMNPVSYGRKQSYPRKMTCGCVAQVVDSRNQQFPVGCLVNGQFGWCDYALTDGEGVRHVSSKWKRSWALGVLGMPGATAYYGLMEIIAPKAGETIVVNACTGAVGMLVGQIAKIMGCNTIGFCSTGKVELAKSLGYDSVIDYRGKDVRTLKRELRAVAPKGVNGFFDNAGGPTTEATLMCLALFARVSVCGQIAYYNLKNPLEAKAYPGTMVALTTQSKIEGFIVSFLPKANPGAWEPAFDQMFGWLKSGQLRVF